jgi:pilus assembly protein CpaF
MQGQATRIASRETAAQAGKRLALITLVDRIAEAVNLAPLKTAPVVDESFSQTLDRAAREQANAMRDEGEAPEGIDLELLVREALRELVGLGPIGPLLEDDEVTEVHCVRHDQVLAVRGGAVSAADASFTSEEALQRVIARLAQQSGESWKPSETTVERRLPRGAHMIAVIPPASGSHVLVIRKRRRVDTSLEELVRAGALSRQMAVFLESCLVARANILVCGAPNAGVASVLAALAGTGPAGERISVLQDVEEIGVAHAHVVAFTLPDSRARAEEAVRAAAKLRPDRLVITHLSTAVASAAIDAIAEGAEGVMVGVTAPTLRQGLARIGAQLALARPGLGSDAVRDAIGESFDIGIEVGVLQDGRQRILRVAELAGADAKTGASRDVFTYVGEAGSADQSFTATGVVPRIVQDLGSRGIKVDQNLFKRAAGRA